MIPAINPDYNISWRTDEKICRFDFARIALVCLCDAGSKYTDPRTDSHPNRYPDADGYRNTNVHPVFNSNPHRNPAFRYLGVGSDIGVISRG